MPNPLAEVFDAPDSTAACGRRNTTAVPTQNLALLNDPFVRDCATDLARRAVAESGPRPADRIGRAYELALGRPPRDDELAAAIAFLDDGDGAGRARRPLPRALHLERVSLHRLNRTRAGGLGWTLSDQLPMRPGDAGDHRIAASFSARAGAGFGMLALADLLGRDRLLADAAIGSRTDGAQAAALRRAGRVR